MSVRTRVFVGLSGGVDSAVSAAILKERGFDVVGVFIKIWRPEFSLCTWKEDRLDAMRVCAALGIPYREIDLSSNYKTEVIDPMLRHYAAGLTPNPDVLCNRSIKFGAFAKWARAEGADRIATGHYARIRQEGGHLQLLRGADHNKDQSYFLYRLKQGDLARTLFPVGDMHKEQVRAKAHAFKLPVAQKHDSQGLCFVGDVSMPDFLRRFIAVQRGPVVDLAGAVIGEHEGAAVYTLGERHGFEITDTKASRYAQYVIGIDTERNTITVSRDRSDAQQIHALLSDVHWIHHAPHHATEVIVQARYREEPVSARIKDSAKGTIVDPVKPHLFPPGQSLVVYEGDACLGGGIIGKRTASSSRPPEVSSLQPQMSTGAPVRKIIRRVQ